MTLLENLRDNLAANADDATRESSYRYFREQVRPYGISNARMKEILKGFSPTIKSLSKDEVFLLCDDLYQSGMLEEGFIAAEWAFMKKKDFIREDFGTFERWVFNYITNWAACDTLCNHTIGTFIETYPEFISHLKGWTGSENRWVKRASAVSLILPARRGLFLKDIFEIADLLMMDQDDMVQKGYGWMLKEASKAHREDVYRYLMRYRTVMPRTAFRYALEKMPSEMREKAMRKG